MSNFTSEFSPRLRRAFADVLRLVSPSEWTGVTFQNSWVNFGGAVQTAQFRKVGDRVELRGTIKSGTLAAAAFTLMLGHRPPKSVQFHTTGASPQYLEISALGVCTITNGTNTAVVLDGVWFSVTP